MALLIREFTCDDLMSCAHSLLCSEIGNVAEEYGFFSKIFAPGCQMEHEVEEQPAQIMLPVIFGWMKTLEDLWGVRIVEVFAAIEVPADQYGTALFYLLMNSQGHGVSLSDNYDMNLAYNLLGDRMKVKENSPTHYEDAYYDEIAEEYCRQQGFGGMIDAGRAE